MTLAVTETSDAVSIDTCVSRSTAYLSQSSSPTRRGAFELNIAMAHAGTRAVSVRWQRQGNPTAPTVVVLGGISADRNAGATVDGKPGWWEAQIGSGRALDPKHLQVLSIDWIGADGTLDAPIDTADQADAIAATLDRLHIATIDAFVGCSYGALVGLQFAARYPTRLRKLIAIAGAHRPHPYASALRALQRKVVALGQLQCADEIGLSLARQLAMLTYRTPEEFEQRFSADTVLDGAHARCAAEDYLEICGARYAQQWSPIAFLRLSESIDLHRVDPTLITVPTTLVAVYGDRLVPPEDVNALAKRISAPIQVHVLRSVYGHDAFLKDVAAVDAVLRQALNGAATDCGKGDAA
ncbi:MAG TPA: homoserine O-succinyltransferase [Xanthomonadaceae bacterium]|jgi:homoserine O-acetyltransferase|nr:homoserine O-succinyltransferase [Xanthomonadaceae bacterium]